MSDDQPDTVTLPRDAAIELLHQAQVGVAFLNVIGTVVQMGWASPGSSLDYSKSDDPATPSGIARDFIAWTSGRKAMAPGCADRMHELGLSELRRMHKALERLLPAERSA